MNAEGLVVSLRVRMSAADAQHPNGTVSPAKILAILADVTTELMIRLDGDEGCLRGLQQVEMLAPVFVGDFVEATGVITKIGNTTRQVALEARKIITFATGEGLAPTAADALALPTVVCRALATSVVPRALQRRPRIVLPALGPVRDTTRLPPGNALITPPPHVVVTPARKTPPEVMIAASIVGGGVNRSHTPHIPSTPEEAASEAKRCVESGASIVVLGVDDMTVEPDSLRSRMADTVAAIRAQTDAVIVVSAVSLGRSSASRLLAFADCGADIVSIPMGSCNMGDGVVGASRMAVRDAVLSMRAQKTAVIAEAYDLGHCEEAMGLLRENALASPPRIQFVFGVPGAMSAQEPVIQFMSERIPKNAVWFAAGVGRYQRAVSEATILLGGNVRVGLSDNVFMRRGVLAEGTWQFVERCAAFALKNGRQPTAPSRAKVLLGLVSGSSQRMSSIPDANEKVPEANEKVPESEVTRAEQEGEELGQD